MANEEHLAIVKQEKEAIADWRKAKPETRLDLLTLNQDLAKSMDRASTVVSSGIRIDSDAASLFGR